MLSTNAVARSWPLEKYAKFIYTGESGGQTESQGYWKVCSWLCYSLHIEIMWVLLATDDNWGLLIDHFLFGFKFTAIFVRRRWFWGLKSVVVRIKHDCLRGKSDARQFLLYSCLFKSVVVVFYLMSFCYWFTDLSYSWMR